MAFAGFNLSGYGHRQFISMDLLHLSAKKTPAATLLVPKLEFGNQEFFKKHFPIQQENWGLTIPPPYDRIITVLIINLLIEEKIKSNDR